MAVISVRAEDSFKKLVKAKASLLGVSMQEYVLSAVEEKMRKEGREYTTDDFNEATLTALQEDRTGRKAYETVEELNRALGLA